MRFTVTRLLLTSLNILACSAFSNFQVLGVAGGGAVVNGSTPLVVMDCHYVIPRGQEAGLVVKWYKDSNPRPVYQWILGSKPQALGILRDRLDLNYQSSNDHLKTHSALVFQSPTTELAGNYTCRVSTNEAEDSATGFLLPYTVPSFVNMSLTKVTDDKVAVKCRADGVFPEPTIYLFKTAISTKRRTMMDILLEKYYNAETELYSVSVESSFVASDQASTDETEIECVIVIPGTDYEQRRKLHYRPDGVASTRSGWDSLFGYSSATNYGSSSTTMLTPLLLFLLYRL